FCERGVIPICALVSPYNVIRQHVRKIITARYRFIEVFCDGRHPLCESVKARHREHTEYEPPEASDLHLRTDLLSVTQCLDKLMDLMRDQIYPETKIPVITDAT